MAFSFLFRSSIKLGIVGGAIYGTVKEGIWGNSEESMAAYAKLVNVLPGAKEYTDKIKIQIPIDDYVNFKDRSAPEYWNAGVTSLFAGLAALPTTVTKYSKIALNKAEEMITESLK